MINRRGTSNRYKLLSGPARLTQALSIDISYNKKKVGSTSNLYIADDCYNVVKISRSPRIGISDIEGDENRFFIKESMYLSIRR